MTNDKCSNSKAKNLIPLQVSGVGDLLLESAPLWAGDPSPVPTACGFSSLGCSPMPGASGQVLSPSRVLLEESQSREKDRRRAGKPTGPAHGPTQELQELRPVVCVEQSALLGRGHTQKTPPSPRKEVFKSTFHTGGGGASTVLPQTPASALWDWLLGDPWDAGRRTAPQSRGGEGRARPWAASSVRHVDGPPGL